MPIIRTRNIADQISSLEQFIKQSEQAGAGLISVVAGTVEGNAFNVVSFVFESKVLPTIYLQRIRAAGDTDAHTTAAQKELGSAGLTALFFCSGIRCQPADQHCGLSDRRSGWTFAGRDAARGNSGTDPGQWRYASRFFCL